LKKLKEYENTRTTRKAKGGTPEITSGKKRKIASVEV
jgi:hypothetical protein